MNSTVIYFFWLVQSCLAQAGGYYESGENRMVRKSRCYGGDAGAPVGERDVVAEA